MNETFELTQRLISFDLDVLNRSKYIKPKIQELILKHKSGKNVLSIKSRTNVEFKRTNFKF